MPAALLAGRRLTPRPWSCSRTRATSATWARACAWPPPPTSPAVLSTGSHDPWHPDALRGAAGLHFALPVARLAAAWTSSTRCDRPLLAIDPDGEPLDPSALDPRAVLAFGSERYGLSEELGARATARVSIPMRAGVSSLNLATSVAAVLFAWRMHGAAPRQPAASQQPAARAGG